ncbi:uncharacterized protein LOC143425398 [Xylocopa sonorina]|uniref:uncharacterized protein LOC143425398 n=1 Tax=Xylocopa sonorina TaxID=1818115 RepID=UPI00403AF996
MALFHPSDIYKESWLLLGIIKVLGLYPIIFSRTACTNYIYVMLLLICFGTLQTYVFHHTVYTFAALIDVNSTFLFRGLRYLINIILFPIILISSMHQNLKLRSAFEQMDNVDQNIKFLNTEIDHTLCMKSDITIITTVIFMVVMSNLMDYYGLLGDDTYFKYLFISWMLERVPDFVYVIVICSFTVLMNKIKFRFQQINLMLNTITKGKSFVSISETSDANDVFRCKLLKWLRIELCKTITLLNEAYGSRFKILLMIYVSYICLHICILYIHGFNSLYMVDVNLTVVWCIIDFIKLVYLLQLYRNLTLEYI